MNKFSKISIFLALLCLFFITINFILADRFLHQLTKIQTEHRDTLALRWNFLDKKESTTNTPEEHVVALDSDFMEISCPYISFPKTQSVVLEEMMAVKWPKSYIEDFHQNFSPRTFYENALAFYCHHQEQSDSWKSTFVSQMLDRMEQFLEEDKSAVFFLYKFKYRPLNYDLKENWRSAFAQGQILEGLLLINEKFPTARLKNLIPKFHASLIPNQRRYEVTKFDKRNYLWFDEYPSVSGETSFILNGHIWTILGLYHHWRIFKDEKSKLLMGSALRTLKDHLYLYQYHNRVSCYDLTTCEKDYDPTRTALMLGWIYKITKDPFFLIGSKIFEDDYNKSVVFENELRECKSSFFSKIHCLWFPKTIFQTF